MAVHDYVIANGTGANVRSDLNNALAAIVSNNSSSTEPGTTYAYQWWADTNANVLKLRNSSNDGWVTLRQLDGTMLIEDGSASTPGLAFADDLNTGIYSGAANEIGFTTDGVERFKIRTTEAVFNDESEDFNFRVESNGNTHMLFVDAGNDRIGIATSSPSDQLHINEASSNANNIKLSGTDVSNGLIVGYDDDEIAQFWHTANKDMRFATNNTERARIDSSGRLLVGAATTTHADDNAKIQATSTGGTSLVLARDDASVVAGNTIGMIQFYGNDGGTNQQCAEIRCDADGTQSNNNKPSRLVFGTTADDASSATERLRITSTGNIQVTGTRAGSLQANDNDSLELFTSATSGNADTGCGLSFYNNDGNGSEIGGTIQVAKENGSTNNTAGYMRFCTRPNATDVTERMRITSGGTVLIGQSNESFGTRGSIFKTNGQTMHICDDDTPLLVNRQDNDGELVRFAQNDVTEGNITVSGSTVSYNGGHLARWSQLASGAERVEILRGSVLSNLDEMCEWAYEAQDAVLYTEEDELPEGVSVGDVKTPAVAAGTEDNEQLNRMKVSDVEGDVNVSGVFQAWDDDDDTYTNDFYCAMTGDFVIRIAQGTTVARGDLLMSAGDGTAKPQDDDIVRSKTIAKVTSTTVSTTYSDGSYCVPCVLMAC